MNQDVKNDLWNAVQNAVKDGQNLPEILREADDAFRASGTKEGEPSLTDGRASEAALKRLERDPNPPYDDV